jgi:excisionase family DNA binding protein
VKKKVEKSTPAHRVPTGAQAPIRPTSSVHQFHAADDHREWLKIRDAALRIDASPTTIRRLVSDGAVVASRLGSAVRVQRESLDRFMRNGGSPRIGN